MSEVVIKCEGLGKSYSIGHQGPKEQYTVLRDVLARQARGIWNTTRRTLRGQIAVTGDQVEEFWALKDASFEVNRGEVVGIIGRNGAGKSTLLKILSRITEPTQGRVTLRGRVASLLEVGTGFHPELTGRENIFLNGAILGMTRAEIKRKFDEIVAFAEVEKFLDTPVKRYSSGMYVRLAFAVAAHLDPEILLIDEVLAVGDAEFQKKCLGKIKGVSQGGRTVLFVSHQMHSVERLCTRVVQFQRGAIALDTHDVREGISAYLAPQIASLNTKAIWTPSNGVVDNPWFAPCHIRICDSQGNTTERVLSNDEDIYVEIAGEICQTDPAFTIGYAISDTNGMLFYWSYHTDSDPATWPRINRGRCVLRSKFPRRLLNEGQYRLQLIGGLHMRTWLFDPEKNPPSIDFEIRGGLSDSPLWMLRRPGLLAPVIPWTSSN